MKNHNFPIPVCDMNAPSLSERFPKPMACRDCVSDGVWLRLRRWQRCIHIRDYITLYMSPLVELIARMAIEKGDLLLDIRLKQARWNLQLLSDWVNENAEFVEWVRPKGGVSAFLRLIDIPDVEVFCHQLAQERKVLLVPGNCFNHPSHVRLGFGCATSDLEQGLAQVSQLLSNNPCW